jgi:hypothetical protein
MITRSAMITRNMKNRKPIFHSMKTRSMVAIEIRDESNHTVEKNEKKEFRQEKSKTSLFELAFLAIIPLISLFIYNKLFFLLLFFLVANIFFPLL